MAAPAMTGGQPQRVLPGDLPLVKALERHQGSGVPQRRRVSDHDRRGTCAETAATCREADMGDLCDRVLPPAGYACVSHGTDA